jgi:hypothetical protein
MFVYIKKKRVVTSFALFNQKQGPLPFPPKYCGHHGPKAHPRNFGSIFHAAAPTPRYNVVPPPTRYSPPTRYPSPHPLPAGDHIIPFTLDSRPHVARHHIKLLIASIEWIMLSRVGDLLNYMAWLHTHPMKTKSGMLTVLPMHTSLMILTTSTSSSHYRPLMLLLLGMDLPLP